MNRRQLLLGSVASIAAGAVARVVPSYNEVPGYERLFPTDVLNWNIDTSVLRDRMEQRWLVALAQHAKAYRSAVILNEYATWTTMGGHPIT